MDSDRESFSAAPKDSKRKARSQSPEMPEEDTYYTVILDDEGESGSDPNARITLLDQRTRKPLSVITTEKEFRSSVEKFTSPCLDAIFGLTNSFFNLWDKNVVLSDDAIWLKEGSRQYKGLANQAGKKVKQLKTDLLKDVEDKERLRQLRDKYCSEAYELRKKAKILQEKLDNLAYNNKAPDHHLIVDSDDKDSSHSHPHTSWQSTLATTNRLICSLKFQTSASTVRTTVQVENNKNYPDVPHFYGNEDDREKWEG